MKKTKKQKKNETTPLILYLVFRLPLVDHLVDWQICRLLALTIKALSISKSSYFAGSSENDSIFSCSENNK